MHAAIREAREAWGHTHPNPAVGAVVVHDHQIVARGHTAPAGGDHAEIAALKGFGESGGKANDDTVLYVTMEPCSTKGRTGACTEAILVSGIRKVVVGCTDPNPAHAGAGIELLRQAGIDVETGIMEDDCEDLNLIFNHWIQTRQSFIAAKVATTIDGRIATRGGLSKWITGPEARQDVMRWRRYFPAIAVGAGTVLADDPNLTVRNEGDHVWTPRRFVFDRNLVTFRDHLPRVYCDDHASNTIVVTTEYRKTAAEVFSQKFNLEIWALPEVNNDSGLCAFLEKCSEQDIYGVYIEGGAHLLSGFLQQQKLHYLFCYRAPKLLADSSALAPFFGREPSTMQEAISLDKIRHETFGPDQLMRGFLKY